MYISICSNPISSLQKFLNQYSKHTFRFSFSTKNPPNPSENRFDIAIDINRLMHIHNGTQMSISQRKAHLGFERFWLAW